MVKEKNGLNHFDTKGQAHMVDVSLKPVTSRTASAYGEISLSEEAFNLVRLGEHKKGDVLAIARIAAIMSAKKTADLIPLCHPLPLTHISVDFDMMGQTEQKTIACQVLVKTDHKTGVEMEALTAVNVALLTVYDMCKAVDKSMHINNVHLRYKEGGKSGTWRAEKS